MNKLPIKEHDIQNAIIELLQYQGYFTWRQNTGAAPFTDRHGTRQWVKFGQPGFSDIFAIQPGTGRFCALEVKHPDRRKTATVAQLKFIEDVKAQGGLAAVVCSTQEAATVLGLKGLF